MIISLAPQIAITAALGYDSYLVMRHGAGPGTNCGSPDVVAAADTQSAEDVLGRQRLGCYFCNDVVAPVDVMLPKLWKLYSFYLTCYILQLSHHFP